MNIYMRMVIPAREYLPRLLVGFLAAKRGHRVLFGDIPVFKSDLPPGIFHTNSLNVTKLPFLNELLLAGMRTTAHDEEFGLGDFGPSLTDRFSPSTLATVERSFSWGPADQQALSDAFPALAGRVVMTGSPRADFWREHPLVDALLGPKSGSDGIPRTVLVISNFGPNPTPLWWRMGRTRADELGRDSAFRIRELTRLIDTVRIMGGFVVAVARLAAEFPDVRFIIRPHPTEEWGALAELMPAANNITVTRAGLLSSLIRDVDAVLHNGSSAGVESVVRGVPTIAYVPEELGAELMPNKLGRIASDLDELVEAVREALAGEGAAPDSFGAGAALVGERLWLPENMLSSEVFVQEWEALGGSTDLEAAPPVDFAQLRRSQRRLRHRKVSQQWKPLWTGRGFSGRGRISGFDAAGSESVRLNRDEGVRFPPLDPVLLRAHVASLNAVSGGRPVKLELIGSRLVALLSA